MTKIDQNRQAAHASINKLDRPIVLIGLMGAGKTTVGRRLAKALGVGFVDSDHEIEIAANMSVAEIFESYGEEEFRNVERRVITRLMDEEPQVLATGGGAFLNEETRKLIQAKALTVWLDADIDVLVERTGRKDTRPLLKQGNPKEILTKLSQERYPIYSLADIRVGSGQGPHDNVVKSLLEELERHADDQHTNKAPTQ